jgi:hypothetical protein
VTNPVHAAFAGGTREFIHHPAEHIVYAGSFRSAFELEIVYGAVWQEAGNALRGRWQAAERDACTQKACI